MSIPSSSGDRPPCRCTSLEASRVLDSIEGPFGCVRAPVGRNVTLQGAVDMVRRTLTAEPLPGGRDQPVHVKRTREHHSVRQLTFASRVASAGTTLWP